jgi:hypothetical protein
MGWNQFKLTPPTGWTSSDCAHCNEADVANLKCGGLESTSITRGTGSSVKHSI